MVIVVLHLPVLADLWLKRIDFGLKFGSRPAFLLDSSNEPD